ncbi:MULTISPECIES: trypsin-like peptidase domain-containing protein [unclassified Flavobacterium]|jgi:Do/DeqQ family serine protease|uniref:trypsin-like peptidase domain-containing protein n=1 Tax=unclassified Flavobacterium TaxID=196869 RepID=UPI0025C48A7F|nr:MULTISPECIES: trypsin-like peptidase domain-containing protein [unclassified Flavobacterium]
MKNTLIIIVLFSILQIFGISCTGRKKLPDVVSIDKSVITPLAVNTEKGNISNGFGDFVIASKAVMPAVVHIKTFFKTSPTGFNTNFGQPYGTRSGIPAIASGSGVIITEDGYIATNNHVVENASEIEVILPDKREFSAELIGRDPNTDLALLKINAEGLPTVKLGNSDIVQVGQWVLAIGYLFSLNTTVTAGIISAKARSIGIINRSGRNNSEGNLRTTGNTAIESFIQTDAAINPGNSGGALVNTDGELIGINSAIASQTGSYAGYSFAIPVNLAKKILDDLKQYGSVNRGILGVAFPSPSVEEHYFKQQGIVLGSVNGVFITSVMNKSAAAEAGLKEGDIIQSIDGIQLASSTEFSERIARHRPDDTIKLSYLRDGKIKNVSATLKREASTKIISNTNESLNQIYAKLGVSFAPLTDRQKQYFNINSGVVVTNVRKGVFFDQNGIPIGTIIAYINGKPINNSKDIDMAFLSAQRGNIQIFAIAPDGSKVMFNFFLGA